MIAIILISAVKKKVNKRQVNPERKKSNKKPHESVMKKKREKRN